MNHRITELDSIKISQFQALIFSPSFLLLISKFMFST